MSEILATKPYLEFLDDAPEWMQDRAKILKSVFGRIDGQVSKGSSITSATRDVFNRLRKSNPNTFKKLSNRLSVSEKSIKDLYRSWRKGNRSDAVLYPQYRVVQSQPTSKFIYYSMRRLMNEPSIQGLYEAFEEELRADHSIPHCRTGKSDSSELPFSLRNFTSRLPENFKSKFGEYRKLHSELLGEIHSYGITHGVQSE